jgi:hypothetical protein
MGHADPTLVSGIPTVTGPAGEGRIAAMSFQTQTTADDIPRPRFSRDNSNEYVNSFATYALPHRTNDTSNLSSNMAPPQHDSSLQLYTHTMIFAHHDEDDYGAQFLHHGDNESGSSFEQTEGRNDASSKDDDS